MAFETTDPWNFSYNDFSGGNQTPETPYGTWQPDQNWQMGLGGVFMESEQFQGSDAPVGQIPNQTPTGSNFTPEQSWWDRNTTGQTGVDNAFRLGQVGLAGLGMASNLMTQKAGQKNTDAALATLDRDRDPNAGFYTQELGRLVKDPNSFLTDVTVQRNIESAREAMLRQAAAQGRTSLNSQELGQLQDLASGARQQRIKTLMELLGRQDKLNTARATIMSNRPVTNNIGAVLPGLQNIFGTGMEYAQTMGYASDRLRTPEQRARMEKARAQYPNYAPLG